MFVYFIKAGSNPPMLKIGKARRPQLRLKELQTGCPYEMKILGQLKCKTDGHALDIEWQLHNLFRREAHRGEWFRYSGHLPYCVNQILHNADYIHGDRAKLNEVFGKAIDKARKYEKPKKPMQQPEELSSIDVESLAHLRAIREEARS